MALMNAKLIPWGRVDELSIEEIAPKDLARFTQHHFFAGIGGWSYALELAGWPEDRPIWTGSCPCQPFSIAGKGKGISDERHLWPVWRRLIAEHRPPTIFGEQVASPLGREWLSGVRSDLEALGYEVGAADLCAASVGTLHVRPRLWWVAHTQGVRRQDSKYATNNISDVPQGASETIHASRGLARDKGQFIKEVRASEFVRTANGLPGRVAKLRGLGNAIVPQIAATFIRAFMETT